LQVEVLVSLTLLRSVAYGGVVGALLGIAKCLTHTASGSTHNGPISSAVDNIFRRLFEQVVASWVLSSAELRNIYSFAVASVSLNTLGIIVYVLILVSLIYQLVKEVRAAAQEEGLQG
jgi:RsiW-degrading membrane proteinase PrsW (M82 family)